MTWSHPRGYDPLVACSELYAERTGVAVEWDKRSLQDFESFPVEELARAFDLIVIDHPHVGQVTQEGCLEPLDVAGREDERDGLEAGSVGRPMRAIAGRAGNGPSRSMRRRRCIAYRPDRIDTPPQSWDEVFAIARGGHVLMPLRSRIR